MRVDRVSAPPARPATRPASGAAGFAGLLEDAAPAAAAAPPHALPPVADILAAEADAGVADRQARRHARAMLQALAALQLAVLGGTAAEARARLAELAAQPAEATDPLLRLILREIGARAAVELARGET
jgi:hypothetical protein